jgi:hypothetical protein
MTDDELKALVASLAVAQQKTDEQIADLLESRDAQLLKIKFEPSHQIEWQDETIGC